MPKKILLLSHCFAPYSFPESYLSAKRMGNIKDYDVDVITIHAFDPWVEKDNNFFEYAQKKIKNIKQLDAPHFYKKLPFHRLEKFFSIPDKYLYLNWMYKKHLRNLDDYCAILTWSMFHSIHLLGCWIKKRNPNLPWITHFSDPWTKNPFTKNKKFIVHKVNQIFEQKVFSQSDLLVFTSQEALDSCLANYPQSFRGKSLVIPHAFDECMYPPYNQQKEGGKKLIKIRYVGTFYGERKPDPFLEALRLLEAKDPSIVNKIEISFLGATQNVIDVSGFNYVKVETRVNYITSLKKMVESDLLLIIDAPFEQNPFLPSKLIDYIGANKPIFGITPPGTSQKLIEEMGFLVAHPNNPEEIARKLSETIQNIKDKRMLSIPDHIRQRYSVESVGKQMKKILDDVIS